MTDDPRSRLTQLPVPVPPMLAEAWGILGEHTTSAFVGSQVGTSVPGQMGN